MKNIWLGAALFGTWAVLLLAQTTEELVNDGKNTENVGEMPQPGFRHRERVNVLRSNCARKPLRCLRQLGSRIRA